MKKFLILFTVFVINSCLVGKAGTPIFRGQLIGEWTLLDDNYKDIYRKWRFTDGILTQILHYNSINKTEVLRKKYYLCSGVPLKCDSFLVGKVSYGTHIIYFSNKQKKIRYYEVLSLKNDTLTVRFYHERAIGREAGYDTIKLKRISR